MKDWLTGPQPVYKTLEEDERNKQSNNRGGGKGRDRLLSLRPGRRGIRTKAMNRMNSPIWKFKGDRANKVEVSSAVFYREEETPAKPSQDQVSETMESPRYPSFDDFGNEHTDLCSGGFFKVHKGHIRDIMISSLVVKELTCAIFHVISKSQGAQPLEAIKVSVKGNGGAGSRLNELVDLFSSTWIIRRYTLEDYPGELKVEEPAQYISELILEKRRTYLGLELDEIFRRIWPGREE